jgi:hypothetical protein
MQQHPESSVPAEAVGVPAETAFEATLTQEIADLWSVHSQTQTVLGRTKEELRTLRHELGHRLYKMKLLLASPGRGGQWSKFLSAQRIPRASADRYAKAYERMLQPIGEIASCESFRQSPGEPGDKPL